MITTALQQLTIFIAHLVVQVAIQRVVEWCALLPKPKFTDFTAKPSQSSNWGRRLTLRASRRPPVF